MNYQYISEKNFDLARKRIRSSKEKVIFEGTDELNRKILEKESVTAIIISLKQRSDKLYQTDAGLSEFVARLASEKKTAIGFLLDELIESKQKSILLARLRQNIKIAKKKKTRIVFIAKETQYARDKYELNALGEILGMPTWMTKNVSI